MYSTKDCTWTKVSLSFSCGWAQSYLLLQISFSHSCLLSPRIQWTNHCESSRRLLLDICWKEVGDSLEYSYNCTQCNCRKWRLIKLCVAEIRESLENLLLSVGLWPVVKRVVEGCEIRDREALRKTLRGRKGDFVKTLCQNTRRLHLEGLTS